MDNDFADYIIIHYPLSVIRYPLSIISVAA